MSKQKETKEEVEPELSDHDKHYAMHADPNRERWDSGLTAPPSEAPAQPPEEVGGGANLPKATGLEPSSCAIGDDDLLLVVRGLNFTSDTLIVMDNVPLLTTYDSETELECELRPSAFTEARGYPVTVKRDRYIAPVATMFTVTEPVEADTHETTKKKRK